MFINKVIRLISINYPFLLRLPEKIRFYIIPIVSYLFIFTFPTLTLRLLYPSASLRDQFSVSLFHRFSVSPFQFLNASSRQSPPRLLYPSASLSDHPAQGPVLRFIISPFLFFNCFIAAFVPFVLVVPVSQSLIPFL